MAHKLKVDPETRCNARETAFAYAYIACNFNGAKAYSTAVSDITTADKQAKKWIDKPHVAKLVAQLTRKYLYTLSIRAEAVVRETAMIAFADMKDFVTWSGDTAMMKPSEDIGELSRIVKKIKIVPRNLGGGEVRNSIEFELYDKQKSLDLLAKHTGVISQHEPEDLDEAQKTASDIGYNATLKRLRAQKELKQIEEAKDGTPRGD